MVQDRIYNFSAGPSQLPLPVLEKAFPRFASSISAGTPDAGGPATAARRNAGLGSGAPSELSGLLRVLGTVPPPMRRCACRMEKATPFRMKDGVSFRSETGIFRKRVYSIRRELSASQRMNRDESILSRLKRPHNRCGVRSVPCRAERWFECDLCSGPSL